MAYRLSSEGKNDYGGRENPTDLWGANSIEELHERILDIVAELRENVASFLPLHFVPCNQRVCSRAFLSSFHVEKLRDIILRQIDFEIYEDMKDYDDLDGGWNGKGLNPKQAMACLDDFMRTSKFIEALFYHIDDLLESMEGDIEMVDAGCGPVPLFGLLAAIKSKRVIVTCIEVNPLSVQIARDIIDRFDLSDRVMIIEGDAESYRHGCEIDLFVSETMFSGLLGGEPMAKIYNNFSPQVKEGGIMIPEAVKVNMGLVDLETYDSAGCMAEQTGIVGVNVNIPLACVLDRDHPVSIVEQKTPLKKLRGLEHRIVASSTVVLHEKRGVILSPFESVITTPVDVSATAITISDHERRECDSLVVRYYAGSHSGDATTVSYVPKGGRTYEKG